MRALITGATGFIGMRLVSALLERGDTPVVLVRDPEAAQKKFGSGEVEIHHWPNSRTPPPPQAFRRVEAVFNLLGEPVGEGRWTPEKKERIRVSRIEGTRQLVGALVANEMGAPKVLVSASGIGIYGDRGDDLVDESQPPGKGFLEELSVEWEREAQQAQRAGTRVVIARIGMVLARGGGAMGAMNWIFQAGLGGRLGSGKQWWSWIHLDDAIGLLLHASQNSKVVGPMNTVSPHPVTNADFTRAYGQAIHRPTFFAVPQAMLELALGEKAAIVLTSTRAVPETAKRTGYQYRYPEIAQAFAAL
jgi:uncharacterized protein (TIGR01777 family)